MSRSPEPSRIGRFEVVRTLGSGAQGDVYLAEDTQLKRRVAIKTLLLQSVPPDERATRVRALLDEALIVGRLSHPNIVTLYDAGLEGEMPWLVFEYVEGRTLSAVIKETGRLPLARAVDIAIQVLKAVGFAHGKGVVHRDLKPANVMIMDADAARVMDFGIAQLAQSRPKSDGVFEGTPAYMAPEYISGQTYTHRSDLYSVGMMLYEMLTGKPAVVGQDPYEILNRVVHQPFAPPSKLNPEVDERLDDLVLKALSKDPSSRFDTAAAMEDALYRYLTPEPVGVPEVSQGTLGFLLRRMRYKSDFPGLASTIVAINRATASEKEGLAHLANCILKDFALTNKLLKLVNSAQYAQFSGSISTVSRAVVIMGFNNVRAVAIRLLLLEHLQNKAQAAQLKEEILAAYFCGLLARELVGKAGLRDGEEAFICSMFHRLGRLLTAFYFHEEFQEVQRRPQSASEEQAAAQVLGITYEELGVGVARAWHFPERLIGTLRRVSDDGLRKPQTDEQRLRLLAELAARMTDAIREPDPAKRRTRLAAIPARFGEALGLAEKEIAHASQLAAQALLQDPGLLQMKPVQSPLFAALHELVEAGDALQAGAERDTLDLILTQTTLTDLSRAKIDGAVPAGSHDARAILTAGIQDITNTLVGSYALNDLLRIILETMYRAMQFTRVLLCIRDPGANVLRGRFGFGHDVDQILKRGFNIPLAPSRDAFYAAISQGADIYIDDVNAESIRNHIPEWYRKLIPARSIALFPIVVTQKPVGLFYADCDSSQAIHFGRDELNLLKTLRNQAVLAIRQHS